LASSGEKIVTRISFSGGRYQIDERKKIVKKESEKKKNFV
jgi:hypothetical protein